MLPNICLLFHCIQDVNLERPNAHHELFIKKNDIDGLLFHLKNLGYKFKLPHQIAKNESNVCSLTLDDGYFNNYYFLDLAEKYQAPFILFLNSFNIINKIPFIWDLWEIIQKKPWNNSKENYRNLYQSLTPKQINYLMNENHRPFTIEELHKFSSSTWANLSLHTHTHQPLVKGFQKYLKEEIQLNIDFLKQFSNVLLDDFSLPCGLYTRSLIKNVTQIFQRVYTADGGGFKSNKGVINRISLINPLIGGSLFSQIENSFTFTKKMKRKISVIKSSYSFPIL